MKEHPILFSTEMVRAILDGRKTQTRRICKFEAIDSWEISCLVRNGVYFRIKDRPDIPSQRIDFPYGQVGDRLWVRENILLQREKKTPYFDVLYCADLSHFDNGHELDDWFMGYRGWYDSGLDKQIIPSIHMPKWAARIFLEITSIRVERVQDISWKDILAEGCDVNKPTGDPSIDDFTAGVEATDTFHWLWDSLNAKRGHGWELNPFVWVIEFKKL